MIYALIAENMRGVISRDQALVWSDTCRIFYCGICSVVHADINVYHNVFGRHNHISRDSAAYEELRRIERQPEKRMLEDHLKILGTHQRDQVTGITGFVTSISFDLNGCIMAYIQPPIDKEGKKQDGNWFDLARLEATGTPAIKSFDHKPKRLLREIAGPAEKGPKC